MTNLLLQTKTETPFLPGIPSGSTYTAKSVEIMPGIHEVALVPVQGFGLRILYLDETEFHSIFSILKKN